MQQAANKSSKVSEECTASSSSFFNVTELFQADAEMTWRNRVRTIVVTQPRVGYLFCETIWLFVCITYSID
jgi:hypothetical protein